MVELNADLDGVFHALADKTRRAMLAHLRTQERTIGELAAPFDMSLAGASKHVKVLESASLIRREKKGRTHYCHLNAPALAEAHQWLETYAAFWNDRLDALEHLLIEENKGEDHE